MTSPSDSLPPRRATGPLTWVLFALFALMIGLGLWHHEIWRDEMQAWLIASHSPDLGTLWQHLRYEGHPGLWYLLLFGMSRFGDAPVLMQLLNGAVVVSAAALLFWASPFGRWRSAGLAFGYFALYEYGIISRSYGLGMLLLFVALACIARREKSYWPVAVALGLLAQTSVYGLLFAGCLGLALLVEAVRVRRPVAKLAGPVALALLAAGAAIYQIIPAPGFALEHPMAVVGFPHPVRIVEVMSRVGWSYWPAPMLGYWHSWNSFWLAAPVASLVGVATLVAAGMLIGRRPMAATFFWVANLGLLTFGYTIYLGSTRHFGHYFLIFIAAWWLSCLEPDATPLGAGWGRFAPNFRVWGQRIRQAVGRYGGRVIAVMLVVQVLTGLYAWSKDLMVPFSASREVASYIAHYPRQDLLLVGDLDYAASAVSGYLGRPFYYPRGDRMGSFLIWDQARRSGSLQLIERTLARMQAERRDALLVLNYQLAGADAKPFTQRTEIEDFAITPLKDFGPALVPDESYYLYLVERQHGEPR